MPIVIEADFGHLLRRDAGRLTKRRVVGNSVRAAVDMARLENGHFLQFAREEPSAPLPLDADARQQLKLADMRNVAPDSRRIRNSAAELRRRLEESGSFSCGSQWIDDGYSGHRRCAFFSAIEDGIANAGRLAQECGARYQNR